ncbi:MAG: response regulator [Chloroflexi bacterium]|nr:response regulator [Chloroflexota bacterium]
MISEQFFRTLLVADDDEANLLLLKETFRDDGRYKLLVAKDGPAALELALRERPQVILMDVMLPGMDGCEVCKTLRGIPETASAKIALVSAMAQESDISRGLRAGADQYIVKPYNIVALLHLVDRWFSELSSQKSYQTDRLSCYP